MGEEPDVVRGRGGGTLRWSSSSALGQPPSEVPMSRLDVNAVRCEALFASHLQRSDQPTPADVRLAIIRTVRDLGNSGCAARVAQEFGDHPEVAAQRMQWARRLVDLAVSDSAVAAAIHTLRYGHSLAAASAA